MFLKLFLLMTIVPILEIVLLLKIHGHLAGFLGGGQALLITIGSVILTGVIGANLARSQGFALLNRIQKSTAAGQIPGDELIEGAMVLVGGVLLLTPGYATDLFGFLLMAPLTRGLLKNSLKEVFTRGIKSGNIHVNYYGQTSNHTHSHQQDFQRQEIDENIIDVETVVDHSKDRNNS